MKILNIVIWGKDGPGHFGGKYGPRPQESYIESEQNLWVGLSGEFIFDHYITYNFFT